MNYKIRMPHRRSHQSSQFQGKSIAGRRGSLQVLLLWTAASVYGQMNMEEYGRIPGRTFEIMAFPVKLYPSNLINKFFYLVAYGFNF